MRLRHSVPYEAGFRRIRRGRGFGYTDADGERITDPATLERIRALVIPPAWRRVWICAKPDGHIQAVGVDAAGRRQYLYHEQWRRERDEEKFDRVLDMAGRLPELRRQVKGDLGGRGLRRRRVEAVAIDLLDRGVFRIGGEEYLAENGSHGLATLLCEHVRVSGDEMLFDFEAKSGVRQSIRLSDRELAKAVAALLRGAEPGRRLLVFRAAGETHELHAEHINTRLRELVGEEFSAKDIRTWQGTVAAALACARSPEPESEAARKRAEKQIMTSVADALGNTPAVARASYVDPRVLTAFRRGTTVAAAVRRADRGGRTADERRELIDRAVIRLLRRTR
ncbi:DNA topoisomerase IB [Nocardia sp. NPDC003693]